MHATNNKILHSLLHALRLIDEKATLVRQFTNDRTASSAEMEDMEAKAMIQWLQQQQQEKLKKMRGKIIHLYCLLGYVTAVGTPDMIRIDASVKAIGSNNPKKKSIYYLDAKEMWNVCNQVEARYKKETT